MLVRYGNNKGPSKLQRVEKRSKGGNMLTSTKEYIQTKKDSIRKIRWEEVVEA